MKSTFKVLFYVKKQSVKNGKAPVMGLSLYTHLTLPTKRIV